MPADQLTVAAATAMSPHVLAASQERGERHAAFVVEALGLVPDPSVTVPLPAAFTTLWKLRWDNQYKDVYWRLTINGLPTAQRMHLLGDTRPCHCAGAGAAHPGRLHHFWECTAAQAVRGELQRGLGAAPTRQQLWLLDTPPPLHAGAWGVVCLAAFNAMWRARAPLCVPAVRARVQASLPASVSISEYAAKYAVTQFWAMLEDFVRRAEVPDAWRRKVGHGHPFLCFPTPGATLKVHRV